MTRQEIINVVSALVVFLCFWAVLITFLVRALGAQGFAILVVGILMGMSLVGGLWGYLDRRRQDREIQRQWHEMFNAP